MELTKRTFRIKPQFIESAVARLEHFGHTWQSWPRVAEGKTLGRTLKPRPN
jgi:hypothetical protein